MHMEIMCPLMSVLKFKEYKLVKVQYHMVAVMQLHSVQVLSYFKVNHVLDMLFLARKRTL